MEGGKFLLCLAPQGSRELLNAIFSIHLGLDLASGAQCRLLLTKVALQRGSYVFSATTGCGTTFLHVCVTSFINLKAQPCPNSGTDVPRFAFAEAASSRSVPAPPLTPVPPHLPCLPQLLLHPEKEGFPPLPPVQAPVSGSTTSQTRCLRNRQRPAALPPHRGFCGEGLRVLTSESFPRGSPRSTSASQTGTSGRQRRQELGKG